MPLTPPPPTGVGWMLLDLNSYFASVEQQLNPDLRGRPVAVVPMPTDSTCAIAASYEAKAFGIKTGTRIFDARQMCPDLVCVLARHDKYVEYHHKVLEEFVRHTPINKVWSIDEMNSRLVPSRRTADAARDLARKIKAGLRANVGECIRASIGIAPNSYLAKLASDMQKPDGLTVIEGRDLPRCIMHLDITDLCGVGPNMQARLNRAGIWTMPELWAATPKQLRAIWGSVEGEKFWYRLHGYDLPDPVEGDKAVIGHSRILDTDSRIPHLAGDVARRLTTKACQRLRRHTLFATRFSLSVRLVDGRRWGAERHLHPASDALTFVRLTHDLWGQMCTDMTPDRIKKVSVSLYGLQTEAQTTGDLFSDDWAGTRRKAMREKSDRLSAALDAISRTHGPHAVHFGNQPKTAAGFVGTKIAFARVPDLAEFRE